MDKLLDECEQNRRGGKILLGKYLKITSKRIFSIESPDKLALASSIGLFIGMTPTIGIRSLLILAVSMIFGLNIISMIMGLSIVILFPVVHLLSFWVAQKIGSYDVPVFTLRYLNFKHFLEGTQSGKYFFIGSIIVGGAVFVLFYKLFKFYYQAGFSKIREEHGIRNFIFYDASGNRRSILKRFSVISVSLLIIIAMAFGVSLSINPLLPGLGLQKIKDNVNIKPLTGKNSMISGLSGKNAGSYFQIDYGKNSKNKAVAPIDESKVFAFYVAWDENSKISLTDNIKKIDIAVPEWFHLNGDMTVSSDKQPEIDTLIQGNGVREMPLINNYTNGIWDGQEIHNMVSSQQKRDKLVSDLLEIVKSGSYYGINIDFENIDSRDKAAYSAFIKELSSAFHKSGYYVSVDMPPSNNETYDYKAISGSADYSVIMFYDEHYPGGNPGPVASQSWFKNQLDSIVSEIPKEKLVVGLANFGYDWSNKSKEPAQALTYSDAIDTASRGNLKVQWDPDKLNPYYMYDDGNSKHTVWFLDGVTMYNQLKYSLDKGIPNMALWRLGAEDPDIWNYINKGNNIVKYEDTLKVLKSSDPVKYAGQGEVLRVVSSASAGSRSISSNANGYVLNESYDSYPSQYEVDRYGKPADKEVALTFDDGPDSKYTPQILDILKKYNANATFFVVGENAEVNPDIIERIYSEGNEIGSHTFTHPNVAELSDSKIKLELNSTQRLIQEITGHSTIIFRPPYVADAEPSSANEIIPIIKAQDLGYTVVGELIDPDDWQKPSSDIIYKRVMDQLPYGNIVLLHDAGGDRSNTVKALPKIIEGLRSQGYKIVPVSSLIGKTRDDIMPAVKTSDTPFILYDKTVFTAASEFSYTVAALFYTAICLGIFRFLFLLYNSKKQHKNSGKREIDPAFKPFISVVVAAYNEEKVICETIDSILESDYENFEIVVVNDGSKDGTSKIVEETYCGNPKVRLINKDNGGKSSAVNIGFKESSGELVVALDADTLIARDAISLLVSHFKNENVAAVSGNVKVGNIHNMLTKWQHIEYVTGFNLERRAFSVFNCITVVPGAIGAWKKEVVAKCGYYKEDTLAEDTDMTLDLLRNGYKIEFEEKAYAYTESPEDLKSLLKQRYRWSFGTLQCLWKHKDMLFNSKYKALGYIALPNMWLFQYLFQSISPIADIYFIAGLFGSSALKVTLFYLAFLTTDYIAAIYAFRLEKEDTKVLVWLFLQRIIYRLLMTYIVLKSIFSALKGIQVGWNKLKRVGSVKTQE